MMSKTTTNTALCFLSALSISLMISGETTAILYGMLYVIDSFSLRHIVSIVSAYLNIQLFVFLLLHTYEVEKRLQEFDF